MKLKYVLNLNTNHEVDYKNSSFKSISGVFENNISPWVYKDEKNLKELCKEKIRILEERNDNMVNPIIGFDEPIYVIYSGLAVVLIAFINELINEGYKPIVLFEDKDNGGYYKMEVTY